MNREIIATIQQNLALQEEQVIATLTLLQEGATIPFIARYRKEKTQNLDEEQIKAIQDLFQSLTRLFARKEEVLRLIEEKGKLTPELAKMIQEATTLKVVEEYYLPYKEKKKTRATIAINRGLEPLADLLASNHQTPISNFAINYLNEEVPTVELAVQGAQDILAERISDHHDYRDYARKSMMRYGKIVTSVKDEKLDSRRVFEGYYDYNEPIRLLANHRILAINRGEKQDILKVKIETDDQDILSFIYSKTVNYQKTVNEVILRTMVEDAYKRLLYPSIEREIRNELTERAEDKAIELFTINLEQLLLTPPLKNRRVLGFDPSYRTGCKLAVVNEFGDFITKDVIYPHQRYVGEKVKESTLLEAERKFVDLIHKHQINLVAIGNGTASRESEEFVAETLKKYQLEVQYIIVSEAGASVYSADPIASKEFPQLDVSERSAISIARRVIDPLAELIKIDPKSIGVGQYQHDVNQKNLNQGLDFTITKVVNNVGVNLNTASANLLSFVSGLNAKSAEKIVEFRQQNGMIKDREALKKVKGIGPKSYEQAVGFLKILTSPNPLDKTFIHPENYRFVNQFMQDYHLNHYEIGSPELKVALEQIHPDEIVKKYAIGHFSLKDIIEELKRPLRDIRDDYPTPILKKDILRMEDLKPGMQLQGTVRSILDFGVFVDIGLKNDGMIHKSKLSPHRIQHPLDVVNIGDIVTVYVIDVDFIKQRVALSLLKSN